MRRQSNGPAGVVSSPATTPVPTNVRGVILTLRGPLAAHNTDEIRSMEGMQGMARNAMRDAIEAADRETAFSRWVCGQFHARDEVFAKALCADLRKYGRIRVDVDMHAVVDALLKASAGSLLYRGITDWLSCLRAEGIKTAVFVETGYINDKGDTPKLQFDRDLVTAVSHVLLQMYRGTSCLRST